jgi:hypothetical protein
MNRNLVGSIYGMSSMKIAHFVLIGQQTWSHMNQNLVGSIYMYGHRGHSIDDSYQVSVVPMFANRSGRNEQSSYRTFHRCFLPSFGSFGQVVLEKKIFKNRPIRNKNCLSPIEIN